MRKFISCVSAMALIAGTSAPAFADTIPAPDADPADFNTIADAQAACDLLAAAHEGDSKAEDEYSGVATLGAATLTAGPTEVAGTRVIDLSTVVGIGFHASQTKIVGDPVRNGGSVNMFGHAVATAGYYDDSTYTYTADFESTFTHAFSCVISVEVFHPEETVHHNAEGIYVVVGDFGESEDAIRGNCAAFTAQGLNDPQPDWFGDPFHGGNDKDPHCQFIGTPASDEVIPEHFDPPVVVATESGTVDQDQTDTLTAFEDHGGYYEVTGEIDLGKVVICISPSTTTKKGVPGEWRAQNGYSGGSFTGPAAGCNTTWFNTGAMTGVTNLNLQGTFISVPPVS